MQRRLIFAATLLASLSQSGLAATALDVFKTSGCGCCLGWVKHIEEAGYAVTASDVGMGELMKKKLDAGLNAAQAGCHTSFVEGYVIEGHVPAEDIARLLSERPEAIGLAVPGMPVGSPGMGEPTEEGYEVLLVARDGSTSVFATH